MGRIANKKTGKLNKPYRETGIYYGSSRGRKRNPWKTTRRKRLSYSTSFRRNNAIHNSESSSKETKGFIVVFLSFIILIAGIAILGKFSQKDKIETAKIITQEELRSTAHPMVADNKEVIKEYYKDFNGVGIQHMSEYKDEANILTWSYSSIYGDDSYNNLMINFSALSTEEQLTLEKVIDIVMSFVPAEEIIVYYVFDKAIYVEREDCIEYELYYKEIKEKINDRPHKFYQDHGFSIGIKQYNNNQFEAYIGTSWYDYVYDTNPIIGAPTSDEELASHQEWQFSLEDYIKKNN